MRAALMWTINDFPAYEMLSGWSTHGKLSCPVCMDRTKAFQLKYSRKPSFFDFHCRFLPLNHPTRIACHFRRLFASKYDELRRTFATCVENLRRKWPWKNRQKKA